MSFEKLKERVEAMRKSGKWGQCEMYQRDGAWYINITGYHREVCGGDTDLWGAGIAGTLGTTSDMSDFTDAAASGIYTAATEVTLTPDTADFATGVVLVVAYFLQAVP